MKKRLINSVVIIILIIINSSIYFANISMQQIGLNVSVQYVSSNPTNDLIAILDWKGNLYITDSSFQELKLIDKNVEDGGNISHNGQLIAYISNNILKIVEIPSLKLIKSKNIADYKIFSIYNMCWSDNDQSLYLLCRIANGEVIIQINLLTMQQTVVIGPEEGWRYQYMATCPKIKNTLFLIGTLYDEDPVGAPMGIYQYDLTTKKMSLINIPKDQDAELIVNCLAISPDGKMLAYIKPYKIVRYSTIPSNMIQISTLSGKFLYEIPFTPEDPKKHRDWYTISWPRNDVIYFVCDSNLYKILLK